jgi:hypothetical protein
MKTRIKVKPENKRFKAWMREIEGYQISNHETVYKYKGKIITEPFPDKMTK